MKELKQLLQSLFVLLLFLMFSSYSVFCQTLENTNSDSTNYFLGANFGINDFHVKDEYLSPYTFRGVMFSTNLSFQAKLKNIIHEVDVFFSTGKPDSDKQPRDLSQKVGSISYSFFYKVNKLNVNGSPLDLYLGTGISSFVMNTDFVVNSEYGYGSFRDQSWYWSHSINFLFRGEYSFNKNQSMSIQLNVPFLQLVSRPANGHWADKDNLDVMTNSFLNAAKDGKMEFLTDHFVIHCVLEYKNKVNDNIFFRGSYRFNYVSSSEPLPMQTYMNDFLIGLDFML
jgi:hypothetical protein